LLLASSEDETVSTMKKSIPISNRTPEPPRRYWPEKWLAMIGFVVVTASAVALFYPR